MKTRIELGSFNRNQNSPIMLKEKIEADGKPTIRIYQRKDIDSIESLKDRIKVTIKYGIEDLCMKYESLRPLLTAVGVKKIDRLTTVDPKITQDLLQSIRSQARIGLITEKNGDKLKEILRNKNLPEDYTIDFYEGKYKTEDLFSDLKKFMISDNNNFSPKDIRQLRSINEWVASKSILCKREVKNSGELIKKIKKQLDHHFKIKKELLSTQPEVSANYIESLQKEIKGRLDDIENEIRQRSINPENEDIKNQLLSIVGTVLNLSKKLPDDKAKSNAEIKAAINILFSTSWWNSEEKKQESLTKVRTFFTDYKSRLPESVRDKIYIPSESTNV